MEVSENLCSLSEIAIALAGFTGIVAVLGHRAEGRWDPLEWLRLRMLLETSLAVFFLSLTPLLLQQLEPLQTVLWRLSNSLQASVHVAGVFVLYLRVRKLEASQWPREERWLTAALLPVSLVIIGAQVSAVVGALAQYGFFLYLLGLVYLLGLAALHFVLLLVPDGEWRTPPNKARQLNEWRVFGIYACVNAAFIYAPQSPHSHRVAWQKQIYQREYVSIDIHIPKEVRMGKLLFVGTFGTDDPTRATMPFLVASGALDRGHEPTIVLMGEAVYLLKDGVADSVQGVGLPPLRQLVDKVFDHEVPIYV